MITREDIESKALDELGGIPDWLEELITTKEQLEKLVELSGAVSMNAIIKERDAEISDLKAELQQIQTQLKATTEALDTSHELNSRLHEGIKALEIDLENKIDQGFEIVELKSELAEYKDRVVAEFDIAQLNIHSDAVGYFMHNKHDNTKKYKILVIEEKE